MDRRKFIQAAAGAALVPVVAKPQELSDYSGTITGRFSAPKPIIGKIERELVITDGLRSVECYGGSGDNMATIEMDTGSVKDHDLLQRLYDGSVEFDLDIPFNMAGERARFRKCTPVEVTHWSGVGDSPRASVSFFHHGVTFYVP